jgi:hypothetical protein
METSPSGRAQPRGMLGGSRKDCKERLPRREVAPSRMVKPLFFVSQGPKANVRLTGKFRDMTLGQQADSQKREFKRDRSKKRSRSQSIATFMRKLTHSGHFLSSNFFYPWGRDAPLASCRSVTRKTGGDGYEGKALRRSGHCHRSGATQ